MKTSTKTYRRNNSPTEAARLDVLDFIKANPGPDEIGVDIAVLVCAKKLAYRFPNKYSYNGNGPNKLASQTAAEIVGKFSEWLLGSKGFILTHCNGKRATVGHCFWMTFKAFCSWRQAAQPDTAGKARRSTDEQKKQLAEITDEQRAALDRISEDLATGLITIRMAESLTADLLQIATGPGAETIAKNSRRYRSKPRQHAPVAGVDPASDDLTGDLASIERRLESGAITADQAADELLAV